uniref:Uncharacterized protein n=1 Tax=Glossina pallidipes TaxID=7398 RepID=A0A1A9ZKW9_GLOPL
MSPLFQGNLNLKAKTIVTTSLIQPLDQGVIAAFKKALRYIFEKHENDPTTLTKVWKKFSTLACINQAASTIAEINQPTLNACLKAAWSECVINRSVAENTSILTTEIATATERHRRVYKFQWKRSRGNDELPDSSQH